MSLQFYLGPSGSGKSFKLHRDIIEWAQREPNRNFLFMVPDQFTMQTQVDLVNASKRKGIMNVDVLSFGRLSHRVFEELGCDGGLILDDTGKSLILRKLAGDLAVKMPVLGTNLDKIGYIHEIKSVISELKLYNVTDDKLDKMIEFSERRNLLNMKLKDIKTVYEAFNQYISDKYLTSEETLKLLTVRIAESEIVKDSVVIFDGFTGFTPVQYALIERLMGLTNKVIFSITIDIDSDPYKIRGEQELFYLSKKTILNLQQMSFGVGITQDEDVVLKDVPRFGENDVMRHLEKSLFRYPVSKYASKPENLDIFECINPMDEVENVCIKIYDLVHSKNYEYRDIAVVCGDLPTYSDYFEELGSTFGIPFFLDENKAVSFNPFVEFLRGAMKVVLENFSYDSVMHFLRCGMSGIDDEDIDIFDNYILRCGIKGKRNFCNVFTRLPFGESDDKTQDEALMVLNRINEIRERFDNLVEPLASFSGKKANNVSSYVEGLYELMKRSDSQNRLKCMADEFRDMSDEDNARRYEQIFPLIVDLLDQIYALLGQEEMSFEEFSQIFESGIAELSVGTIPAGVDRVLVGDMERSRLGRIKVLFFIGVNDGSIPKKSGSGGLLSDIDRDYLKGAEISLAPTPREQSYIQRFYLYLNMTKPSERLYISFSRMNMEGKPLRESYMISQMQAMFPNLRVKEYEERPSRFFEVRNPQNGLSAVSDALREYAQGQLSSMSKDELLALIMYISNDKKGRAIIESLIDTAFFEYKDKPLSGELARKLYGSQLLSSVSRFEKYASCAYAHFLNYGMRLAERDEFAFERRDLGSVFHAILDSFAKKMQSLGYTLTNFPDDIAKETLDIIIENESVLYGRAVLRSTASNEYMLKRIKEIMQRTVLTTREQLSKGSFVPSEFEYGFTQKVGEREGEYEVNLCGKIDRIDICKDEDKIYVKVMDYKSSKKDIELDSLLYGIQLQQPLYMIAAINAIKRKYPEFDVSMGAMLYYQMTDPLIDAEGIESDEEILSEIEKELKPTGFVSMDKQILKKLDDGIDGCSYKSSVIPAETLKSGLLGAGSRVLSKEDYDIVSDYTEYICNNLSSEIMNGKISINPIYKGASACKYCVYKDICPYDDRQRGYMHTVLTGYKKDDALEIMRTILNPESENDLMPEDTNETTESD